MGKQSWYKLANNEIASKVKDLVFVPLNFSFGDQSEIPELK